VRDVREVIERSQWRTIVLGSLMLMVLAFVRTRLREIQVFNACTVKLGTK
jgi:hypothetical protein